MESEIQNEFFKAFDEIDEILSRKTKEERLEYGRTLLRMTIQGQGSIFSMATSMNIVSSPRRVTVDMRMSNTGVRIDSNQYNSSIDSLLIFS